MFLGHSMRHVALWYVGIVGILAVILLGNLAKPAAKRTKLMLAPESGKAPMQ
jgi:hypothetical protein